MANIIALIIAYLLGSLSSAILIAKFLKLPDPRSEGSKNPGAANILRIAGKNKALLVLAGDILKGSLAVLIARILGVQGFMLGLIALSAILGHVFPLFFKFKGGKGMATMVGTLLLLSFWVGLLVAAVWIIVAFVLRFASLASLSGTALAPIFMLIFGNHLYAFPVLLIAALVVWCHRSNIKRLLAGTETKIKF